MGISVLDAITIQTNEVRCDALGPFKNGKYGGIVYMVRGGEIHRPIISVDYGYYPSAKIAAQRMEQIVTEVRQAADSIFPKAKVSNEDTAVADSHSDGKDTKAKDGGN